MRFKNTKGRYGMEGRKMIEVIGPGCPFCKTLYKRVNEVVTEQDINADVRHVTDLRMALKYFPFMPVMKVDGAIVHKGKWLPNKEKIHTLINRKKPVG